MTINLLDAGTRALIGQRADELYLTAVPTSADPPKTQAHRLYSSIRATLTAAGAGIFSERIFASREAMADVQAARRAALGDLDDGVPPTRVVVAPGRTGALAGVQIHAVAADSPPEPVRCAGPCGPASGRRLQLNGGSWLALGGLGPVAQGPPREQARRMFECIGCLLRREGADMRAVVRTWLWLKDICDWYGDLNAVRTAFFKSEGLIREGGGPPRLPASTGIGLGVASGAACAADLLALPGAEDRIELTAAGGHQNSAFAYGSAFSRAAVAPMPGGRTLFISGTAAIGADGRTEHVGRAEDQIDATIRHAQALLRDAGLSDGHVLGALVYCKSPQVEEAFRAGWSHLLWPHVSMIADICRPELLFEVELAAGPVADGRKE